MTELVLAADDLSAIRRELLGGRVEGCAVLYASQTARADGTERLLVREVVFPAPEDYGRRGPLEAELRPPFVARVSKQARLEKAALVFVHSHPGSVPPVFSTVDDEGERHLSGFLAHRVPGLSHAALVVSEGGVRARHIGTARSIRVVGVGGNREVLSDPDDVAFSASPVFDRQVRAFGQEGQRALQGLRVAVVGLGGMGSVVSQQLAHLGVRDFILIDPDTLEATNLNRVANATPALLGRPKVEVAAAYIRAVAPDARVNCLRGDVTRVGVARELVNADLILGCTDSHGSRAVLQQVAYQYLIPCIDTGVTIAVAGGRVTHVYGRVQLLAPGHACLTCGGLLDPNEVRRDMMTPFERQADPYIRGAREPAPAVMSLNGTVASLSVTMLLAVVCGVPSGGRHLLYNGLTSVLRTVRAQADSRCYICSRAGSFARGDSWPLLGRRD
jgi:molybdopterin/thiamine biosynthesis adenylyltransferase